MGSNDTTQSINAIGQVESVTNEVCVIKNLTNAALGSLVEFSSGGEGIILGFEKDRAQVTITDRSANLKKGDLAKIISDSIRIPVTERLLGRIIDPLGRPLDGLGDIRAGETKPIESPSRPIYQRALLNRPLQTGYLVIDSQIPIGLGQRELLLGERKAGNDELAVDIIINQAKNNTGVLCVYVALDAESAAVKRRISRMKAEGALANTIVIFGRTSESATLNYIAPMTGTTIAEWFAAKGKDVLIVFDNLTRHAKVYRQLSLLLNRPASREAYPGDVFYLHSRLLERCGAFNESAGGGTITALPVVETQSEEVTDYITTNLMSITDGHVLFKLSIANRDIQPPIDSGFSVSRLGGRVQTPLMRSMADALKQIMIRYNEFERSMSFGAELHGETKEAIELGTMASQILHQSGEDCYSMVEEVMLTYFVTSKSVAYWSVAQIPVVKSRLLKFIRQPQYVKLLERVGIATNLEQAKPFLDEIITSFRKDPLTPEPIEERQSISAETETVTSLLREGNEEVASG